MSEVEIGEGQALLNKIKVAIPGAIGVRVEYGGTGDDGGIEGSETIYPPDCGTDAEMNHILRREVERYADEAVCGHYQGYYNDEGGCGNVYFDLEKNKITINHCWYETNVVRDKPIEVDLD